MGVRNYLIEGVSCSGETSMCTLLTRSSVRAELLTARVTLLSDLTRRAERRGGQGAALSPEQARACFHTPRSRCASDPDATCGMPSVPMSIGVHTAFLTSGPGSRFAAVARATSMDRVSTPVRESGSWLRHHTKLPRP